MFKKVISLLLALAMVFTVVGCGSEKEDASADETVKTPEYADKQFEISGFWAPYEITEESFTTYKDAGFTHIRVYGDRTMEKPAPGDQRIYIKARKGKRK